MKLLFENWRGYIHLLQEGDYSFKKAMDSLNSEDKKMYKLYKRHFNRKWHEDVKYGYLDPREDPEPEVPEEKIRMAAAQYKANILDVIPLDLAGRDAVTDAQRKTEVDKNQGISVMWLRKLSIKYPHVAQDIIEGIPSAGAWFRVWDDLEIYFQHNHLMPKRNLFQVESIAELSRMVENKREEIEGSRQAKIDDPKLIIEGTTFLRGDWSKDKEEIESIEDLEIVPDGDWTIMEIHNKAASCFHGTQDWCTASPEHSWFEDYYDKNDPLFIFVHGSTGERFQFHYGSDQFMDAKDKPLNSSFVNDLHALLLKAGASDKYPILNNRTFLAAIEKEDLEKLKELGGPPYGRVVAGQTEVDENARQYRRFHGISTSHRIDAAQNTTNPEMLSILSEDEYMGTVRQLINNVHTPLDILINLMRGHKARGTRVEAMGEIVQREGTPPELLRDISNIAMGAGIAISPAARSAVAKVYGKVQDSLSRNPRTPLDILRKLASPERDMWVRRGVAGNPSIDLDLAVELLNDKEEKVRRISFGKLNAFYNSGEISREDLVNYLKKSKESQPRSHAVASSGFPDNPPAEQLREAKSLKEVFARFLK